MKKLRLKSILAMLVAVTLLMPFAIACEKEDEKLNASITFWHYYNDKQKTAFEELVNEFNETRGRDRGIVVTAVQKGSRVDLYSNEIAKAAAGDIGADPMPNMFLSYPDTAMAVDKLKPLADFGEYFSSAELAGYNTSFLDEGRINNDGKLKNFPTAKSTEMMTLNKDEWDLFSADVPAATLEKLATIEGLIEVSELYYNWSGGKAFYGRDSLANYFIIGAKQLGIDLFGVDANRDALINTDKAVIRKLWESYYVPYLKGYFACISSYRTDDLKNKNVLATTSSTASAAYDHTSTIVGNVQVPTQFIIIDNPYFEGKTKYAFQQGAGISVVDNTNKNITKGCVEFIKWFTDTERNIGFSAKSSYMPVKKEALNMTKIESIIEEQELQITPIIENALSVCVNIVNNHTMYTNKPFPQGNSARTKLDDSMRAGSSTAPGTLNYLRANVVKKATDDSITKEQALEELGYISDNAFETWYSNLCTKLNEAISQ